VTPIKVANKIHVAGHLGMVGAVSLANTSKAATPRIAWMPWNTALKFRPSMGRNLTQGRKPAFSTTKPLT